MLLLAADNVSNLGLAPQHQTIQVGCTFGNQAGQGILLTLQPLRERLQFLNTCFNLAQPIAGCGQGGFEGQHPLLQCCR